MYPHACAIGSIWYTGPAMDSRHTHIDDDPAEWVRRWRRAEDLLEAQRLRDLKALSELESARRFASVLRVYTPYPLRPSSGLVEQQRVFNRLRNPQ